MRRSLSSLLVIVMGCSTQGLATTHNPYQNKTVHQAEMVFWATFNEGRYDKIPLALEMMEKGLLEAKAMAKAARSKHQTHLANANVGLMQARAGWLHLWRVTELPFYLETVSMPQGEVPLLVREDLQKASDYFQRAYEALSVSRPYPDSFESQQPTIYMAVDSIRGVAALAYGKHLPEDDPQRAVILRNAKTWLKQSKDAYPVFKGFSRMAFELDELGSMGQHLTAALRLLEGCSTSQFHQGFDGFKQDFAKFLDSTHPFSIPKTIDSICINTKRAPHNFESQWLYFGDLLFFTGEEEGLAHGQVQARDIYKVWNWALNGSDYSYQLPGTSPGTKPLPRNPKGWPFWHLVTNRLNLFEEGEKNFRENVEAMNQLQRRELLKKRAFAAPRCLTCHMGN